ncbi:hypothetical protein RintRC_6244 [Richelia intracellularis]|nr:hypothetical protein RintRC_6244 [Richelia intracellularis]
MYIKPHLIGSKVAGEQRERGDTTGNVGRTVNYQNIKIFHSINSKNVHK